MLEKNVKDFTKTIEKYKEVEGADPMEICNLLKMQEEAANKIKVIAALGNFLETMEE